MTKSRNRYFILEFRFYGYWGCVIFYHGVGCKVMKAGEISPESTPTPIMMFRLEGACTDEMVYVKLKGESDFATLKYLVATGKVINTSEKQYKVENSITNARVYVNYDPRQNKC